MMNFFVVYFNITRRDAWARMNKFKISSGRHTRLPRRNISIRMYSQQFCILLDGMGN